MKQEILLALLSAYPLLLLIWIAIAVVVFFILLKITAPFGRHSSRNWGPMINNRLAWFIMEFTVIVVLWLLIAERFSSFTIPAKMMVGLFTFHYINRSLIFPFRLRTGKKKMPVVIMFSAVGFNLINGFMLGFYFRYYASYEPEWMFDIRFIAGVVFFITGLLINWQSDNRLIRLRKSDEESYQIPYGGLFKYVSCPNHFGEIIEWLGFALLCWNVPALAFFIWTCSNLIPRAIAHHRWYQEHFKEYPKERKAIFPLLL